MEKNNTDSSKVFSEKFLERKVKEEVEKRIKELKDSGDIEKVSSEPDNVSDNKNKNRLSRRDFLKKIGIGAFSIGAISINPASSQLKLTKNGIKSDSGTSNFNSLISDSADINNEISASSIEIGKISGNGSLVSSSVESLEGPGININSSNELQSDLEIPQDVSNNRSLDTWYQNNSGNPIYLMVSINGGSSVDARIASSVHINSTQSNDRKDYNISQTSDGQGVSHTHTAIIPSGAYYKIEDHGSSSGNIYRWEESQIGV